VGEGSGWRSDIGEGLRTKWHRKERVPGLSSGERKKRVGRSLSCESGKKKKSIGCSAVERGGRGGGVVASINRILGCGTEQNGFTAVRLNFLGGGREVGKSETSNGKKWEKRTVLREQGERGEYWLEELRWEGATVL